MADKAEFALRNRNPDVLTCIANLSNDEVFTPPFFANQMLDLLAREWATDNDGADIWADPSATFLDPCTKSGVFLREITSRLVLGLAGEIPDLQERVDHILTKQVHGIAITKLTALLARRSVYCSKSANGKHSIVRSFDNSDGNIWFKPLEHVWLNGRCRFCGAGELNFDRGDGLESHAYELLHAGNVNERIQEIFGAHMQFDVVIGNPPYQLDDGGFGTSAAPIYNKFVEQALELNPRYLVMVTPSRWFAGGKGLDQFRQRMLNDRRIRKLVDYPKLYDGFPGVKIRGGISYFLWNRDNPGPCSIQTMWDGEPVGHAVSRDLDQFDVLIRRNEAVPILEKVRARSEAVLSQQVSSRKPFGLPTNFHGQPTFAGLRNPVKLFGSQRLSWIEESAIQINKEWVFEWKVLMTAVQGTSAAVETKFLSKPIVAEPGTACSETYLVAGHFETEEEARSLAAYLRTRFVRFLVSLRKQTQHATRDVYAFVPAVSLDREWTDSALYKRYALTKEEIAFIESQVAEHDDDAAADEPSDD